MLKLKKEKLLMLLMAASVVCSRLCYGFNLNLTESCNGSQLRSCVLSDISPANMEPFTIENSTQTELGELIIRDAVIVRFPREIFKYAPNLHTFVMHYCGLNRIDSLDFEHALKLRSLILQRNRLSVIQPEAFIDVPLLKKLQMSQNHIHTVHKSAFTGLTNLIHLALQQNAIQELSANLFSPLVNLEYLDLSGNEISKIDSTTFAANTKLTTLLLNNNKFIVFEPNSLEHLPHLHLLDVSNSFLEELNTQSVDTIYAQNSSLKRCNIRGGVIKFHASNNALTGLNIRDKATVRELELHGNLFETLDDFVEMLNLQHLDLSKNHISSFAITGASQLLSLPNLSYLNLAFNKLKQLRVENFLMLSRLTHLDIAFNHISRLEVEVFEPLLALEKIFIDGNGLHDFNYEKFIASHPLVKEIGLVANYLDSSFMREMSHFLEEHFVQLAHHYPTLTYPAKFQQHNNKSTSDASASPHADLCECFMSDGDILTYIILVFVTIILALQIWRIMRDKNCASICWRRRSTFLGEQWQTEPLNESVSEV